MINLEKILKPTLLLDEGKCRRNIKKMVLKAGKSGVILRPHFKTHQSHEIGSWFSEEGVDKITVSSVTMASHFAAAGWNDITIAFPFNVREAGTVKKLAKKSRINLLAANVEHLTELVRHINFKTDLYIKINTGHNRSGIEYNDLDSLEIMREIILDSSVFRLTGLLTHAGHTYKAMSGAEIESIYHDTVYKLQAAGSSLKMKDIVLTSGDTPAFSIINDFSGLDEIRPGNFIFYDLTQSLLGSCSRDEIAVCLACPVVERVVSRRELIIYGGGVHLSKDSLSRQGESKNFGLAVIIDKDGWHFPDSDSHLRSISQEHGIISASDELFRMLRPGDLVGVIPVHSCMTADLMQSYHTLEGRVISDFPPRSAAY